MDLRQGIHMLAFSKALDAAKSLLIVLDNNLVVKHFNQQAKKVFNWRSNKETINKSFDEVCLKSQLPILVNRKGCLLTNGPVTINGHIIQWQQLKETTKIQGGSLLIGQDVTNKYRLKSRIRKLLGDLKEKESQEKVIYKSLENISKEVTGQELKEQLPPQQYVSQVRDYFENIIAEMPCFVHWKDQGFRYLGCNNKMLKDLGFKSKKDFIGKTDYDLFGDKEIIDSWRKADKDVLMTGWPKLNVEDKVFDKKGNLIHLLSNKMPLFDKNKNVIGIVCISVDVTKTKEIEAKLNSLIKRLTFDVNTKQLEQKQIYRALKDISHEIIGPGLDEGLSANQYITQVRNYYESIIDKMPCYVFWKDINYRYLGCNDIVANLLNLKSPNEVFGKTDYDFGWEKWRADEIREIDKNVIETGQAHLNIEEIAIERDGSQRNLLGNKMPLFNDRGEVIGIVGISVDITERKRIEAELRIAKEAAEAANHAKTEFIANMSHDIRTPLNGVIGIAELLRKSATSPQDQEYGEMVFVAGQRLLELLNSVLDVVNADHVSEDDISLETFHLPDLLRHLCGLMQASVHAKGIELNLEIDKELPTYVVNDQLKVHRILQNLLGNSIKFTHQGSVSLEAQLLSKSKNMVKIQFCVTDTGIGIPANQIDKVFDRFSRVTPSYEGVYQGHGVGLYIVKKFITLLGGKIDIKSEVGKGTHMSFVLAMKVGKAAEAKSLAKKATLNDVTAAPTKAIQASPKTAPLAKNPIPTAAAGKAHILFVEDNPLACKAGQKLLENLGYSVTIAENAEKGLSFFKAQSFDFVISDLGLPGMQGNEMAALIRYWEKLSHRSAVPIIGLTAHADSYIKENCLVAGMDKVYLKPLDEDLLKEILANIQPSIKTETSALASTEASANAGLERDLPATEAELFQLEDYPLFDEKDGLERVGNRALLREMLMVNLQEVIPQETMNLEEAHLARDWDAVQEIAHKLKGSSVYCGTIRMTYASQYLERYWKAGHRQLLEELYQQLMTVIEQTRQAIQAWL